MEESRAFGKSGSSSTTLPDLHSQAYDSYANGVDEVDCAVLANPNKLQPTIQKFPSIQ